MTVPVSQKIYHILHVDRLASVLADGCLWCDAEIARRAPPGTTIGMNSIKQRRLNELTLASHPGLYVGECVPFYFCPRSIMLYVISCGNHNELAYTGGQQPIIHLESDLRQVVAWADENDRRWAFTTSNAGSRFFDDYADLGELTRLNWSAIQTNHWGGSGVDLSIKEGKQAEFLIEHSFPWHLVERIGVINNTIYTQVVHALAGAVHRPPVEVRRDWYY